MLFVGLGILGLERGDLASAREGRAVGKGERDLCSLGGSVAMMIGEGGVGS